MAWKTQAPIPTDTATIKCSHGQKRLPPFPPSFAAIHPIACSRDQYVVFPTAAAKQKFEAFITVSDSQPQSIVEKPGSSERQCNTRQANRLPSPLHRQSRRHEIELDITVDGNRSLWQSYLSTHVDQLNVPALACLNFDSSVFEGRRARDLAQPV